MARLGCPNSLSEQKRVAIWGFDSKTLHLKKSGKMHYTDSQKSVSIIIPAYNEAENIALLHQEVKEVCMKANYQYEVIVIDDGSSDNTCQVVRSLSPVKYVRFRKNFGQTAAMDAGIKNAKYRYIVTMDGDRQNDPTDIPAMIEHLEQNDFDVVSGWRRKRKDNFAKRFVSRGANFLRSVLVHDGIHDSGCSLKVFRRECFENLNLYGEMHRFIPALLKIRGFTIGEIEVHHRPRVAGRTKYNWSRTIHGFIDMISVWFWNKFAVRPLHLLGGLGLFFITIGGFAGIWTIIKYFMGENMSESALPIMTAFLMLSGIQFFISGLIADTLNKSYYETTKNQPYNIRDIVEY